MSSKEPKYKNSKILVLDDVAANVELIEMMLNEEGYLNVISTTDPAQAIAIYKEFKPDLLILDIRMPGMDGFDVMSNLSDGCVDEYLPILVLTAQQDSQTKLQALRSGAKDFLTKPFDQVEALNRIENMLEVRSLYNRKQRQADDLASQVDEKTRELQEAYTEIRETQLEVINRLGRAGEYRDCETGMHVVRMSEMCRQLSLDADLGEEFAELILQASPMHDVGKIGIPDSILLKPGPLDDEEWKIMRTHTIIGAEILRGHSSSLLKTASEIALTHHEKWDGSGYPNGLSSNAIPLAGRVCAICDVFDALTSKRPYKEPWSIVDTLAFIGEQAGRHFDPKLAKIFCDSIHKMVNIKENYAD
ncbi:HD domain-containing phosphohydrolase [Aestuariispira insulae]|nr:HD domain-containing phosphohydrolase [Aestuariispira insulae]